MIFSDSPHAHGNSETGLVFKINEQFLLWMVNNLVGKYIDKNFLVRSFL